jgi:lysophospholipase L1-like esterase
MEQDLITISTIGDSLTEGSIRASIIGDNYIQMPNCYQGWTYNWLHHQGMSTEIRNYGIGGQIIEEICGRIAVTVSLPTDLIVIMAGTNDLWRYSDMDPDIEKEISEAQLERYREIIPKVVQLQTKKGLSPPMFVICSIPPFGNVKMLPKNVQKAVKFVNSELEKFVVAWKESPIMFCDVHKAMRGDDFFMREGLAIADGVHFTIDGNKACGEAIAKCIFMQMKKK